MLEICPKLEIPGVVAQSPQTGVLSRNLFSQRHELLRNMHPLAVIALLETLEPVGLGVQRCGAQNRSQQKSLYCPSSARAARLS